MRRATTPEPSRPVPTPARFRSTIASIVVQPEDLRELRTFHKALADVNRLRIVRRLADGEASVAELIAHVGLSQPLVSHHLKRLRVAGLVDDPAGRPRDDLHPPSRGVRRGRGTRAGHPRLRELSAERMTISNESRDRVKGVFEPVALAMGRAGLTPDALTLIGFAITVVGRRCSPSSSCGSSAGSSCFARRRVRHVRRHAGPRHRPGQQARRVHGQRLRSLRARRSSTSGSSSAAAIAAGSADGAPLLAAAPRWAARSWSATPEPSPKASASRAGTGHGRCRHHAPRSPPRHPRLGLILGGLIGRSRRSAEQRPAEPALPRRGIVIALALAIIAIGATITAIQRILHVRSQADSPRPRSSPANREQRRTTVSKNGKQRQRQERRRRRPTPGRAPAAAATARSASPSSASATARAASSRAATTTRTPTRTTSSRA